MHARSALFDLYGDHLRRRGNQAPVAALVRLLAPVGVQPPAVRTAISRMVLQDWLEPVTLPAGRGYRATAKGVARLDTAGERIYRRRRPEWDGTWQLVLPGRPGTRAARTRLRQDLSWLGYGELAEGTWISPWRRSELAGVLDRAGVDATTATAADFTPSREPLRAWDLTTLGEEYATWLDTVDTMGTAVDPSSAGHDASDEAAFAARFHLVHEWRKFLFRDPGLPEELLPAGWPGRAAAARFAELAGELEPATDRFVDRCLGETGARPEPGPAHRP